MADTSIGPGTVLAGRFRLDDLLSETKGAKFWRATDRILARSVAVNVIEEDDPRGDALLSAARTSATVTDGHFLRVLDCARESHVVYVVNEWGSGLSLDHLLADGPLPPRRAAWLVKEVADAIATAHRHGVAHGRLIPENVIISEAGAVKLIGFVVDAVLAGRHEPKRTGGHPMSDHESDVVNLAALLYATLVGRWPGSPGSRVPPAPREHGNPLRPRQVRAGVPRPLDTICDRVLNAEAHQHQMPIETAHEIAAALSDFIGDPTGIQVGAESTSLLDRDELGLALAGPDHGAQGDPGQDPGGRTGDRTGDRSRDEEDEATRTGEDEATRTGELEATQAGTPLFFDNDTGVGWTSPDAGRGGQPQDQAERAKAGGPPPPLPEPEPRPLFAPDPPAGRRPSQGWDPVSGVAPHRPLTARGDMDPGPRSSPGTGSIPLTWGPDEPSPPDDTGGWENHDAGRSWMRLAAIVATCVLLLLAVVVAFNLGRGSGDPEQTPAEESPTAARSTQPAAPVEIADVEDLDPEGDPPEENPDQAGLAIDGDPSTAWETMTYFNNPQLGLLKDGVGLRVDLGRESMVSEVQLRLQGSPTDLELLAAEEGAGKPDDVGGLIQVATKKNAGERVELTLEDPVTTRYLVVWLTSLPPSEGGFRGRIAEIVVRS